MRAISITTDPTVIPADLITLYAETIYQVDVPGKAIDLHIGVESAELAELHAKHKVTCSAFITACNPYSQELSDEENEQLQANLASELTCRNLKFFSGMGRHPSGNCKGEQSYLALGLDRTAAVSLGNSLRQNAIVCCGPDAVPQLVLLK